MKVLIACEESQTSCIAWRKAGHEAYSCDIQPCSGGHPEWHIQTDVLSILNPSTHYEQGYDEYWDGICFYTENAFHRIKGKWDLIIAHPPCTYLSTAGFRHLLGGGYLHEDRYQLLQEAAVFFRQCLNADSPRVCVVNPAIFKLAGLPPPTQYVHPYYFGDPYFERTGLWLKGLPPLFATNVVTQGLKHWIGDNSGPDYCTFRSAKLRSKSFSGMAQAMVDQWGCDSILSLF